MGTYISVAAMIIAVGGLALQYFGVLTKIMGRLTKVETQLSLAADSGDFAERVTALETKVELFWKAIEGKVVDLLKSPTNKRKDKLLGKMQEGTLGNHETHELRDILQNEMLNKVVDGGTAIAYALCLGVLAVKISVLKGGQE